MLKMAKEKYLEIKFDLLDLEEELPYSDEQFDIIFCNQVLMDLKNISSTIANFSRVLTGDTSISLLFTHAFTWATGKLMIKEKRRIKK
ncbi:Methyltransferase type 11 [Methanolacinia petrolearia DSM 11571]|uniref:Methyltransferase type 11 n=1 Tax=Methanolacinia petrolearia (strain DSM 11571 / OCM 486 / SEBR 4847) TaxID=679926 RepID=E1RIJ0_METP4|nr:Methyltransferase type 11 [Methanolacinia petrolearia DSM 11571]